MRHETSNTRPPRSLSIRRRVAAWITVLAVGYVALVTIGCGFQERLIFPRHFAGSPTVDPTAPTQRWWIDQDEPRVLPERTKPPGGRFTEVWFEPATARSAADPGPVVLYVHGNGEIIEEIPRSAWTQYLDAGVSVAVLEYRGYGKSDGTPGEARIVRDAVVLRDHLASHPLVDADRMIYHGRSIGGGVAAQLAARRPPAAMVLDSTFTSVPAVARRFLVPPFLIRHQFRTDRVLADARWPVLLSHGTNDTIIPHRHSEQLHATAPDSTLFLYEGDGHNDMPRATALYRERLHGFLDEHRLLPAPKPPGSQAPPPTDPAPATP